MVGHMFCVPPVKGLWKTALVHRSHDGALRSLRSCGGEDLFRREGIANEFVNFLKSLVSALGKDAPVSPKGAPRFSGARAKPRRPYNVVSCQEDCPGSPDFRHQSKRCRSGVDQRWSLKRQDNCSSTWSPPFIFKSH